jgi:hypothetical protein
MIQQLPFYSLLFGLPLTWFGTANTWFILCFRAALALGSTSNNVYSDSLGSTSHHVLIESNTIPFVYFTPGFFCRYDPSLYDL